MGRQTRLFLSTLGAAIGAFSLSVPVASAQIAGADGDRFRTPAPAPVTITVQPGDTLSGLATELNLSWLQLAGWNGLADPNLIVVGEVLKVPAPNYQPPAPPPPAAVPRTNTAGSLETCVLWAESRSTTSSPNAYVRNGQYWGAYQFSYDRWIAAGGSSSSYGSASFQAQQAVFENAIATGQASAWTNYDGC